MIADRHTVLIARAVLPKAEALAAIAQAQVADANAIIEDLKLRIAKARQDNGKSRPCGAGHRPHRRPLIFPRMLELFRR
ncbi:hypothetical protein [Sphingomonas faeni]|uniref:hypothetical protein n=1 Tax=Sphingomonas faeni TaxID=185950 RepID=UPI0027830C61|nr:hypothetical protein [Sphingomonas faeni]MDQ0839814.1 hypothetical protein [Sphingomonas faeni]